MLLIICPNCGPRNDAEFAYRGEVVPRPDPSTDPATWRRYLYTKQNRDGWNTERWFHVSGCRRFLDVERHSTTNEIRRVNQVGSAT